MIYIYINEENNHFCTLWGGYRTSDFIVSYTPAHLSLLLNFLNFEFHIKCDFELNYFGYEDAQLIVMMFPITFLSHQCDPCLEPYSTKTL